jgi:hypothetical protein
MRKGKLARVAGFTVAAGATASLVGFAATGTGAYFSDAKDGNLAATTGDVQVATDTTALSFDNLFPGQFKSQSIDYTATGTGPEDIYLAFDDPNGGDAALNAPADAGPSPLGRYGHLAVASNAGTFSSYNLSAPRKDGKNGTATCNTDANGHGGGGSEATSTTDYTNPGAYCPVPEYILLDSGITSANGQKTATITFGYTRLLENGANNAYEGSTANIPFRIVAEQAGVSPTDPNTTNGR